MTPDICDGCGKEWFNVFCDGGVCMDCVKARHRAAVTHRCGCGAKKRPSDVHKIGSRRWVSCLRCLGTIKQLS